MTLALVASLRPVVESGHVLRRLAALCSGVRVKVLFGGPRFPLGWTVGFLRVPFAEAYRATLQWRRALAAQFDHGLRVGEPVELTADGVTLLDTLRALDPLQTPSKKELLVGTDGEWTMNLVNTHLGGDSMSWVGHLSGVLACEGIVACHVPEEQYALPATRFDLLGPTGVAPLRYIRRISAGKFDAGRWEFRASGEPQPFEEPDRYTTRRVRDRFDRAMLLRYLAAKGIEPDRDDFFRAAVLLEIEAPFRSRESSVAETQYKYRAAV